MAGLTEKLDGIDCLVESNNSLPFPLFCLGHLAYYQALMHQKNVVLDIFETFPKATYRNHYSIVNSQGLLRLAVPLSSRSSKDKTKEIEIDYNEDWVNYHLKSIKAAYSSAPFYIHYIDDLKSILKEKHKHLHNLNYALLNWTFEKLDIKLNFEISNDFPQPELNAYWRFDKTPNKRSSEIKTPFYPQQFEDRLGFTNNLSILDLLMNEGPAARLYLKSF